MKGHLIMYSRCARMLTVMVFSAVLMMLPFSVTVNDADAVSGTEISINSGAAYTNSRMVLLSLSYPGAVSMQFSADNADWESWQVFNATKTYIMTSGDGVRTIHVRFKDSSDNLSSSYSDDIILDATKPEGTIAINNEATATGTAGVLVTLGPSDDGSGVKSYCLSNSAINTCGKWTAYKAGGPRVAWTLAGAAKDGEKTVYALFKDAAGNISNAIQDTIILDTTKPKDGTCTVTATDDNTLLIEWTAPVDEDPANEDPTAKTSPITLYKLYHSTEGSPQCLGLPLARFLAKDRSYTHEGLSALKTHYYRVCAIDSADNVSSGATAKGKPVDEVGPDNARVIINGGAEYTNKTAVTLRLLARDDSGVAKVCVSNTETCTNWQTYAANKTFTLSSGQGLKTVYARFKDGVGNASDAVSSTIAIDTVKPVGQVVIGDGAAQTYNAEVMLQLAVTDANPGVLMQFSNNGSSWSDWEAFAATKTWRLAAGTDGAKTVSARFRDAAGNLSATVRDTINLDMKLTITTKPFTTRRNSVKIGGGKETGVLVNVGLNGVPLDESLITQTLNGTTWTAQVETLTPGDNLISASAEDSDDNETIETLTLTYDPFVASDLAGDWFFVASGFNAEEEISRTGYGTLHFDDAGDILTDIPFTGNYSTGAADEEIAGQLSFDGDGVISGDIFIHGETMAVIDGKMDDNETVLTLLTDNEMLTAIKRYDECQNAPKGKWYVYGVSTLPDALGTGSGTLIFDDLGTILSGAVAYIDDDSKTFFKGNASGSILSSGGDLSGTLTLMKRKTALSGDCLGYMTIKRSLAVLVSATSLDPEEATDEMNSQVILVREKGDFERSDLDGRWRLEGLYNSPTEGKVQAGYMNIVAGKIADGELGGDSLVVGTKLFLQSSGSFTGTLETVGGAKYSIKNGKLDSTKKIMTFTSDRYLFVGYSEQ